MNKKLNYLAVIPVFGTVILLFWLFIKLIKNEIAKKKYYAYFICCGLVGGLSVALITFFLYFINLHFDILSFIESYGMILVYIISGYIMNFYSFTFINLKWDDIHMS